MEHVIARHKVLPTELTVITDDLTSSTRNLERFFPRRIRAVGWQKGVMIASCASRGDQTVGLMNAKIELRSQYTMGRAPVTPSIPDDLLVIPLFLAL